MKMTISNILRALVCGIILSAATASNAVTITLNVGLTDPYALGDVIGGIQAGGQANRDALMINNLLTVSLAASSTTISGDLGDLYQRTANVFSPLPAATATGAVVAAAADLSFGTGTFPNGSVFLTLSGTYQYLVAAYDGQNAGAEIYDISGIASGTIIELPRNADNIGPSGSLQEAAQHQMTGWTLLNPTSVPDGGSTVALLGGAIVALGALGRRFRKI